MHCVFQTTRLERDHRSTTNEEFMLDDATWLEGTWHESEIGSSVHDGPVSEELVWCRPEVVRVPDVEIMHAAGASSCVRDPSGWQGRRPGCSP